MRYSATERAHGEEEQKGRSVRRIKLSHPLTMGISSKLRGAAKLPKDPRLTNVPIKKLKRCLPDGLKLHRVP